jgi:hypothetical protein
MNNYVKTLAALISESSSSPETKAMVGWLNDRRAPLTNYLKLPAKQAETVMIGFTDARESVQCVEKQ